MSERLTDSLDREWTLAAPIGRGTWGQSRLVRAADGREAVLKVPLTEADFPADAPLPDGLVAACRASAEEQIELLQNAAHPFLVRLEATVDLGGGRRGLILPRYRSTLAERLEAGLPLTEALETADRCARLLAAASAIHGNLRPTNILFGEGDDLFLADVTTKSSVAYFDRLATVAQVRGWLPHEASGAPTAGWDTWAIAQFLHAVANAQADEAPPRAIHLVSGGLDKVAIATMKDRALAQLSSEGSNPRFRSRVADRLGALLSRALSADNEPSPPFRFAEIDALGERLAEVLALVRPHVEDLGRILLPGTGDAAIFQGDEPVEFSVTVACTHGVRDQEDLVCGVQLIDLDAEGDGRITIEDAQFAVQVHPSGRLRYKLGLPAVAPGRYRVRVAFAIKDSGDDPKVATGEFQVRPPAGYVPPIKEPPPSTLSFPGGAQKDPNGPLPHEPSGAEEPSPARRAEEPLTDPGYDEQPSEVTPGEVVEGLFPRPIAPPEDDEHAPPDVPRPLLDPTDAGPPSDPFDMPAPAPGPTPVAPPADGEGPPGFDVPTPVAPLPPLRALPDPPADDAEWLDTEELLQDTDVEQLLTQTPASDLPPSAEDDLPEWEDRSPSGLPAPLARLAEVLRRDTYVAVGAAVAACLVLLLGLSLVLKTC